MNPYEQRRQARAERLRTRAASLSAGADALHKTNHKLLEIMNGSPILVGHHSERRHRRDIDKMDRRLHKAVEMTQEAAECTRRADAIESNDAISSDDPEAIEKLRAKLAEVESKRSRGVAINTALRKAKQGTEGWQERFYTLVEPLGFNRHHAIRFTLPDVMGDIGVPAYRLRNWASECKRLAARLAELEARASTAAPEPVEMNGARIMEEDNRVRILFPGKPSEEVRQRLRASGFLWAPSAGAWQRKASPLAWDRARDIVAALAVP